MSFDFNGDLAAARKGIDLQIGQFLNRQSNYLNALDGELAAAAKALESFLLRSGKRFRPLLAYAGLLAAKGDLSPISADQLSAITSLEYVHVAALIHDDVMDRSDTRRGLPSLHRHFEQLHNVNKWGGDSAQYGVASAILLGDLALIWASQNLHKNSVALSSSQALEIFDEMQLEVMAGQFLDVTEQVKLEHTVERALKVATFKSSKYSVERPLQFGAALAGASADLLTQLGEFGIPLGIAFQLRDDLLGVFGDAGATGKPAGGDLIEGKRTALIALTLAGLNQEQTARFNALFGRSDIGPEEIRELQHLIEVSGAITGCEELIQEHYQRAKRALDSDLFAPQIQTLLLALAEQIVMRAS